jgi:hypothetical protein
MFIHTNMLRLIVVAEWALDCWERLDHMQWVRRRPYRWPQDGLWLFRVRIRGLKSSHYSKASLKACGSCKHLVLGISSYATGKVNLGDANTNKATYPLYTSILVVIYSYFSTS